MNEAMSEKSETVRKDLGAMNKARRNDDYKNRVDDRKDTIIMWVMWESLSAKIVAHFVDSREFRHAQAHVYDDKHRDRKIERIAHQFLADIEMAAREVEIAADDIQMDIEANARQIKIDIATEGDINSRVVNQYRIKVLFIETKKDLQI
ncbi:hypothetical protein LTR84_005917 [Exophiala bonariae]|uniref:Uncharacterized protein n=1 Tax=Exophiala bonariae TaxID=1690606 RepID=A0AAV9N2C2_9EURO|nr:hypothetical protein LTR84_005917 [Exophiala bonariae]